MTTTRLMKANIKALLVGRGLKQKDLAEWCRKGESWASKNLALDKPDRAIPLKYWDRISDFFGLETYQLLQPGISALAERRTRVERRSGNDRRIRSVNVTRAEPQTLTVVLKPEEVARLQRIRLLNADDLRKLDELLKVVPKRPRFAPPNTGSTGDRVP